MRKHDDFIASATEAEKKQLLVEEMGNYLTTGCPKKDVDFLMKMDSCRLVPLFNLIKYHISRGVEEVKHTEEEWKSLLVADLLAENSLYHTIALAGLSNTEREKMFRSADTMALVTLGCVNDILGQVRDREGHLALFSAIGTGNLIGKKGKYAKAGKLASAAGAAGAVDSFEGSEEEEDDDDFNLVK